MSEYAPQPGDVINTEVHPKWWQVHLHILKWAIQRHQKKLGLSDPRHTHTMLALRADKILSVTFPRAKWVTWDEIKAQDWDAYRLTTDLERAHMATMSVAAHMLIGTWYDIGQLLDMARQRILGYPMNGWRKWADFGSLNKVCSVGVAICFRYLYTAWSDSGIIPPIPKLFGGIHVERTTPAHFASTPAEFEHVGSGGGE